jgi:hypothetical protein
MRGKLHAKLTEGALQLPSIDGTRAVLIEMSEHSLPVLFVCSFLSQPFTPKIALLPTSMYRQSPVNWYNTRLRPKVTTGLPRMGTAYLAEANVSGSVLVLIRCETYIIRWEKQYRGLTKMFIKSFTVSMSKPETAISKLTSRTAKNVQVQSPLTNAISKNIIDVKWRRSGRRDHLRNSCTEILPDRSVSTARKCDQSLSGESSAVSVPSWSRGTHACECLLRVGTRRWHRITDDGKAAWPAECGGISATAAVSGGGIGRRESVWVPAVA